MFAACQDGAPVGALWLPPTGDQGLALTLAIQGLAPGWLAVSVARQIGMENDELEVIQSGSVFEAGEAITEPMRDIVMRHLPKARIMRLDGPPVVGAVILGMEQAGFDGYTVRDEMVRTAKELVK